MKSGTRIELLGTPSIGGFPAVPPELAKIDRPRAENLPMPPGYHLVRFGDGGKLLVHESRFRVVDNRS